MGLSEWPQGPGDHVMRTHLFSAMTNVTATEGALSLECDVALPALFSKRPTARALMALWHRRETPAGWRGVSRCATSWAA